MTKVPKWMMGAGGALMLLAFCMANDTWGLFVLVVLIVATVAWNQRNSNSNSPSRPD